MSAAMLRGRPPGWWIPWTFLAGFLLVVAVNGVMIWVAVSSWTGLVTDSPYDRGLDYNRNLEAAAAMAALGWRTRLELARAGEGGHELRLEVEDRAGAPLAGLAVEGRLERPLVAAEDVAVRLEAAGAGRYVGRVALSGPGQWQARLRLVRGAEVLLLSERLVAR